MSPDANRRDSRGIKSRSLTERVTRAVQRLAEQPYALGAAFLLIWALGTAGFMLSLRACDGLALIDSIYRALQTFGLNFDLPRECGDWPFSTDVQVHPVLQVARLLAALFTIGAVVLYFARSLLDRVRFRRQCGHPAGRRVLLGFGTVNHALASELRAAHPSMSIVAVDKEFDEADRKLARAEGVLLVAGELTAPETLEAAKLDESGAVFVAVGDDATNIEVATAAARSIEEAVRGGILSPGPGFPRELAERFPPSRFRMRRRPAPPVFAHLSSLRMVSDLKEARDAAFDRERKFVPFSLRTDAARALLDRARLTQRARDRRQTRVHLVLAGLGDQGEALFVETLLTCYAQGLGAPRITFIDRDARGAKARLTALYPRVFDGTIPGRARPDLATWIQADIETLGFERDDPRLKALERPEDAPTAWVFACRNDTKNLDAALRLEFAMNALRRHPAPIFMRLWGARINGETPPEPLRFVEPFGDIRTTVRRAALLDDEADELPQRLHHFYQKVFSEWKDGTTKAPVPAGGGPADGAAGAGKASATLEQSGPSYRAEWEKLPENVRESNRRAARHGLVKLADLGLQWRGMEEGRLPRIASADAERFVKAAESFDGIGEEPASDSPDWAVLRVSEVEHDRWMTDRALSGWQQGPDKEEPGKPPQARRDNRRRWQDNITLFANLDTRTKAFDMALLRAMFDYLAGEAAVKNPPAFPHKPFKVELDEGAGAPPPDRAHPGTTELVLSIGEERADETEAERRARRMREKARGEAFVRLAAAWAKTPEAVRLQIRTRRPLAAPPLREFEHPEFQLAHLVYRLHEAVGKEILVDITPRYDADPPKPAGEKAAEG